jgi:hypothetical protein
MGDVTIPGVTDEELLRAAAMDAAAAKAKDLGIRRVPDLELGQFTRGDWERYERASGRDVGEASVKRDLDAMVKAGILVTERRRDPRVGRAVWAYWYVEDGTT